MLAGIETNLQTTVFYVYLQEDRVQSTAKNHRDIQALFSVNRLESR